MSATTRFGFRQIERLNDNVLKERSRSFLTSSCGNSKMLRGVLYGSVCLLIQCRPFAPVRVAKSKLHNSGRTVCCPYTKSFTAI